MILDEINKANVVAFKEKNAVIKDVISVIKSRAKLLEVEKRTKNETLTDADMATLIQKLIKELTEAKENYLKVGNDVEVKNLEEQIAFCEKFLPKKLTTEEVKNIIMRWLLTTVTKETTCGAYNRLADEMAAVCEGMNDGSRTSENASFAASIAAMTACEEIIGGRADDGVNEDLIYAFDASVVKTVGKDALSTVIAGLQGKEEDGTSRLNKARVDGIKTNFEISIYNTRIARAVLDEVIEYSKTLTVPKE